MKNYVNPLLSSVSVRFLYNMRNIIKNQNKIVFLMFSDGIKMQHTEVTS